MSTEYRTAKKAAHIRAHTHKRTRASAHTPAEGSRHTCCIPTALLGRSSVGRLDHQDKGGKSPTEMHLSQLPITMHYDFRLAFDLISATFKWKSACLLAAHLQDNVYILY